MIYSNLFNTNITTGGYEQLRFSAEEGPDFFENKLYQGYGRNLVIDNEFTYIVATGKWRTNAVDKWYSSRGPEYFYKKVKQGEYA